MKILANVGPSWDCCGAKHHVETQMKTRLKMTVFWHVPGEREMMMDNCDVTLQS